LVDAIGYTIFRGKLLNDLKGGKTCAMH